MKNLEVDGDLGGLLVDVDVGAVLDLKLSLVLELVLSRSVVTGQGINDTVSRRFCSVR